MNHNLIVFIIIYTLILIKCILMVYKYIYIPMYKEYAYFLV